MGTWKAKGGPKMLTPLLSPTVKNCNFVSKKDICWHECVFLMDKLPDRALETVVTKSQPVTQECIRMPSWLILPSSSRFPGVA